MFKVNIRFIRTLYILRILGVLHKVKRLRKASEEITIALLFTMRSNCRRKTNRGQKIRCEALLYPGRDHGSGRRDALRGHISEPAPKMKVTTARAFDQRTPERAGQLVADQDVPEPV